MKQNDSATPATVDANEAMAEGQARSVVLASQSRGKSHGASRKDGPPKSVDARVLIAAIQRIEDVVDEETAALEARRRTNLDEFSERKSRIMLELVRSARAMEHLKGDPYVAERLQRLRAKLDKNHSILQMHLEAVREVSTIIAKAIRDAESDGTYSRNVPGEGR